LFVGSFREKVLKMFLKDRQTFILFNLSLVTFLVMLGLSFVAPILPSYAESFQVSYIQVGLVISSFAITRMILDIPTGFILKRVDKRLVMMLGLSLIVISSVIAGAAPDYNVLLLGRTIEGAGSALYVTTATVFLAQIAGKEKRGKVMGTYSGILLLGAIFGPTFGGVIASYYGIRAPFFAYAIAVGAGLIPTFILPKLSVPNDSSRSQNWRSTFHDIRSILFYPSFFLGTLATFALFFMRTGVRSMLVPLFAANNLRLDSNAIGFVLTLAGITTAVTMVPMGSLSDKIGRRNPLIACLLLTAAATLLVPYTDDLLLLSLSMAVYGAVIGLSGPIAAFVTDVSPPNKLELSMSLYRMISDIGFIGGPLILGYLVDTSGTLALVGTSSAHIGVLPFAVASLLAAIVGLSLFKAKDPVKDNTLCDFGEPRMESGEFKINVNKD
jgi:DHA1 family multidrug resistance protein-like MFS transporter